MAFTRFAVRRPANFGPAPYGNGMGGMGGAPGVRHGAVMTGGPSVSTAPAMAPGVAPFQASINNERALGASKAATFAAAAPLPMSGGQYSGAYGTGPAAGQAAMASRAAYVGEQSAKADMNSGDFFTTHALAADANDRANTTATADAAAKGAWSTAYPGMMSAQANERNANAAYTGAKTTAYPGEAAARNKATEAGAAATTATGKLTDEKAKAYPAESAANQQATKDGARAKLAANDAAGWKKEKADMTAAHKAEMAKMQHDLDYYRRQLGGQNAHGDPKEAKPVVPPPYQPPAPGGQAPAQGGNPQSSADPGIHVNPQTGQRIRWDGQQWSQIA